MTSKVLMRASTEKMQSLEDEDFVVYLEGTLHNQTLVAGVLKHESSGCYVYYFKDGGLMRTPADMEAIRKGIIIDKNSEGFQLRELLLKEIQKQQGNSEEEPEMKTEGLTAEDYRTRIHELSLKNRQITSENQVR